VVPNFNIPEARSLETLLSELLHQRYSGSNLSALTL